MAIHVDKKQIGMWGLVMLTLGNIVNSMGIAVVAGNGYSGILIFLIACVLFSLPCLIVSNFLAVHYKHDGGLFHWIQQAFGQKSAFITTWLSWISVMVSFPAFMTFNVSLLAYSIDMSWLSHNKIYIAASSIFFVWFFTWIASRGVKGTVKLSACNTIFSYVVPITLLFLCALIWIFWGSPSTHTPLTAHNILPTDSIMGVLALLGVAVFMVAGLEGSGYFINYVKDGATYKKAMTIAFIVVTVAPIIAIFSMLTLIPLDHLSDSNGLMQAFTFFFNWIHFHIGSSIILFLYFVGQMMAVATLILFGVKAMEATILGGLFPKKLLEKNKFGISHKLIKVQALFISIIIIAFTLIPSLSSAYALIVVIVGIASIVRYIFIFAAAGKIMWHMPRSRALYITLVCAFVGGVFSLITFGLSFIPPIQNDMSVMNYEILLGIGVFITIIVPFIYLGINALKKPKASK